MQRAINGPDKEWLTLEDAASWMGIGATTLQNLVNVGKFPKGARVSDNRRMWNWMDCVAYMHLQGRMPDDETVDDEELPPKKTKVVDKS